MTSAPSLFDMPVRDHTARPPVGSPEWLLEKVDATAANGCWTWLRARDADGYGRAALPNAAGKYITKGAHRVAYEIFVGPIADGMQIDHLCCNPPCCNPAHLEPVTPRENSLRSIERGRHYGINQTHCVHGHLYDEANTYWMPYIRGGLRRVCRTCQTARLLRRDRRNVR